METESPEVVFEEQCGVILLTSTGLLSIHCTLCEKQYRCFDDYAQHIEEVHIEIIAHQNNPDLTESIDYSDSEEFGKEFNRESNSILIERCSEDVENDVDEDNITTIELGQQNELAENEEIDVIVVGEEGSEEIESHQETGGSITDNEITDKAKKETKTPLNKYKLRAEKGVKLTPAMKRKLKREQDGPIYKCPKCDFSCNDKSNLLGHIKRHSANKPHKCTECSKGFYTRTELQAHMRSHTGERPFLCTDCGRGFTTSSKLTFHIKRHKNQRDKQCSICDQKFFSSTRLRDHMLIHSEERPFKCSLCGTSFKSYIALKNHLKLHENKRKYKCPLCSARFNQNPGLYSHMKKKHSLATNKDKTKDIN